MFPPVGVLFQVVWHLAKNEVSGVIVVPVWPRSSFFNFFFPDGVHLASWVVGARWTRPYYICGPLVTSRGFRGRKAFDTVLAKVDFSNFNMDYFYLPAIKPSFCRMGGCAKCDKVGITENVCIYKF